MADELMSALTRACDASMLRGDGRRRHESVYWWTEDIAECRRACLRARRLAQRARSRASEAARREDFAVARRNLHVAIKASKHRCWKQLCDEADRDVWGKPYRTVMSCLKGPRGVSPGEPELVRQAVSTLFPRVATLRIRLPARTYEERIPEVSVVELHGACRRVRDQAAPGPDGIPNLALKAAAATSATGCWSTPPTTARRPTASQRVSPGIGAWPHSLERHVQQDPWTQASRSSVDCRVCRDDIALTIVDKKLEDIKATADDAIRLVRRALSELGLQTADQKTEVLLVTSRKLKESITLRAGDCDITSVPCIRYLGVHIDDRLRFDQHLKVVSEKAARVTGALSGLMPNIGGPRCSWRRLYTSVVDSVLLYGAPTWREATGTHSYVRKAEAIHRRACLRAICGFRSISHEAVHVLAGTPPLVLLVDERSRLYERSREDARGEATSDERAKTLEKWQTQWSATTKGRWTHRLIPSIAAWIERRHGEVNYHLTQLLSGHGCFRSYLCRTKNDTSSSCPTCHPTVEDVEHVIFHCPRFTSEREELYRLANGLLEPETIVGFMLENERNWEATSSFASKVMTSLRSEEKARRR
ncbi:unnamed protein product [Trichogramma brassicae]|uniref:Reverse transcriptase zinc-binding domain-containing protein n=1 Tax=Trichogramma brassicae TaxID=86971 RepID=A0A6H5J0C5_9HYME|nr:unnamed protein product [Trichogramma brassicae]